MPHQSQEPQKPRRVLISVLAAALLPLIWASSPWSSLGSAEAATAASTTLCTGFTSCASAGMPHDGYKTAKANMYWNMYSGVNCTNYVAYRMIRSGMSSTRPTQLATGKGNATYWGGSFGSLTTSTPAVGSVAWWKASYHGVGSAGHVARVEQVLANGDVVVSESNYGSEFDWRRLTMGGSRWPSGFIHLKDTTVTVTAAPTISGVPAVGQTLTANPGTWSPQPTAYGYQWYGNGVAIAGANGPTLALTPAQLGQAIWVNVQAVSTGYAASAPAGASASSVVQPGTQSVTVEPSIVGTPQVDNPVKVDVGSYAPGGASTRLQWLADGKAIQGATGATFVPTAAQANTRLSVQVTAIKAGYANLVRTASAASPVVGPRVQVSAATIKGETRVGSVLTVALTIADPAGASSSVVWLRDGKAIEGASGTAYRLKRADIGHRISAQVTVSAHGYVGRTYRLRAVKGIAIPVNVKVLSRAKSAKRVWVRVRVTSPEGIRPKGLVGVKIGHELHRVTLRKGNTVRVKFTHAGSGTKTIRVQYFGTERFAKARAVATVEIPAKKHVKAKKHTK